MLSISLSVSQPLEISLLIILCLDLYPMFKWGYLFPLYLVSDVLYIFWIFSLCQIWSWWKSHSTSCCFVLLTIIFQLSLLYRSFSLSWGIIYWLLILVPVQEDVSYANVFKAIPYFFFSKFSVSGCLLGSLSTWIEVCAWWK